MRTGELFVEKGLNVSAICDFFQRVKESECEIQTVQMYRGGKRVVRIARYPYSCSAAREEYSLSKIFTSTLIGIVQDMGLLSVEDRVLDIFPEIQTTSEKFHKMKVKHVLNMNTGHAECVFAGMAFSQDSVKEFFSVEPDRDPGTLLTYNTGASCLLGAMIEKVTGKTFFDFACEKLFYPLGIHDVWWKRCVDGRSMAGAGIHISSDDIAKLGLLYMNGGVYHGRRIISEEWIRMATAPIANHEGYGTPEDWTAGEGTPNDWTSGYGYHFWRNKRDGYRGDGAYGQMCLMLPKYDAVVVVQGTSDDTMAEFDAVFDLVEQLFDEEKAEEHTAADDQEAMERLKGMLEFAPGPVQENVPGTDRCYLLEENPQGFRTLHLVLTEEKLSLHFSDGRDIQTVSGGNGEWCYSEYTARNMITTIGDMMPSHEKELIRSMGYYTVDAGKINLHLRYLTDPNSERFEITTEGDRIHIHITGGYRAEENCHIRGCEIQ